MVISLGSKEAAVGAKGRACGSTGIGITRPIIFPKKVLYKMREGRYRSIAYGEEKGRNKN